LRNSVPTDHDGYETECLDCVPPFRNAPERFMSWLAKTEPNVVLLNSVAALERTVPHIPPHIRSILVVHGLMPYQVDPAVELQASLDAIVAVSQATARTIIAKGVDASLVRVIYNGIHFSPCEPSTLAQRSDIAFLGGGSVNKGAKDVIRIWQELAKTGYAGMLHWLGPVDERLKTEVRRLESADRITLHGYQKHKQVLEILGQSAALLMPSRSESFGLAVVEAMSMGCLPVVWNVPSNGIVEIVGAKYEFAVPEGDVAAAAKAVYAAIDRRAALAQQFRENVRKRFSVDEMWNGYSRLLSAVSLAVPRNRQRAGQLPEPYRPKFRVLQLVPPRLKEIIGAGLARYPAVYRYVRHRL
jgi:glycosyltransferase involved in cell wall biosynthesis